MKKEARELKKVARIIVKLWRDYKAIFSEGDWEDFIRHLDLKTRGNQ